MLSIIIPTFNEQQNISLLIPKIIQALPQQLSVEIIIVDDNSPDGTWETAQELAQKYPCIRVKRRLHVKGLSSAVMDGFSMAMGDYLLVMDADLQHDESVLGQFILALNNGADLVIGCRSNNVLLSKNWSLVRRFISWVATRMAQVILPQIISDPLSGFFAIRKSFFKKIADEINPRGFKILLEFVYRSENCKIVEIPYVFKNRVYGESKLTSTVISDYLLGLYDLRFGKIVPLPFLKYSLVGFSGVIVNQFVLWCGINLFHLADFVALALSIETSLLSNYWLNNLWTFRQTRLKGPQFLKGLVLFHAVCLLGALLNYSLALALSHWLQANIYLTNLVGIAISTLWNYLLNLQFTWKKNS